MSERDAQLVHAILGGQTALFADVIRCHDRRVREIVERGIRDPDSREEIVQQTFYLAFRNLPSLADGSKLAAWLTRIAHNGVSEFHRRRRALPAALSEDALREQVLLPATSAWIWDEVVLLSPPAREILELRYRQGLSYAEIAERLQVPRSTVRGRIYQARLELRKRLADERD